MEAPPLNGEGVRPVGLPEHSAPAGQPQAAGDFASALRRYIQEVDALQDEADRAVRDLAIGRAENIHQVIAAVSEADLSFRLMVQIRNRLVEAYREIMRMQV